MPSFLTAVHSVTIKFYIMKLSKLMIRLPTYDTFLEPTIMPIITVKTKDGLPRVMT